MSGETPAADLGAPYRYRLSLLAEGRIVEDLLDSWAAEQSSHPFGSWHRIYGKLQPQRSPWALLVFRADSGDTVGIRLLEPDDTAINARGLVPVGDLGVAEIVPCVQDPALPGLRSVLEALEDPRVVRYHPGSRCTVHGRLGPAGRYVKVFATETDDQREAHDRWTLSTSGALTFAVAEPQGWDQRSRSSWYGVVPGEPLEPRLLGPQGLRLARQVGISLGELAIAPLSPAHTDDAAHQLRRTERALARGARASPALSSGLQRGLVVLARLHDRLGPRRLVPVHGAAHPGQWLVDETGRLGLVDFDRFAWGEPEFDLASFLVEREALDKGRTGEAFEDAAVGGFREVAGRIDAERLALYVAHRRLARVARLAAGLRPDGGDRAARALEEVEVVLRTLVSRL